MKFPKVHQFPMKFPKATQFPHQGSQSYPVSPSSSWKLPIFPMKFPKVTQFPIGEIHCWDITEHLQYLCFFDYHVDVDLDNVQCRELIF